MVKSADTADLKSADPYQVVGVQVPLRAPSNAGVRPQLCRRNNYFQFRRRCVFRSMNRTMCSRLNPAFRVLADSQAHVWEQRSQRTTELCEANTKLHFLSAAFWWYLVRFCYARNRRMQPANPRRPVPTKPKLAGSGTAEGGSAAGEANREKEASRSDCVAGGGGAIEV